MYFLRVFNEYNSNKTIDVAIKVSIKVKSINRSADKLNRLLAALALDISMGFVVHITDSLCKSALVLEMGGLVCVLIIFMEGRCASALAGRTGTWLSRARPSPEPAAAWCSHGLAVLCYETHKHTFIMTCRENLAVEGWL